MILQNSLQRSLVSTIASDICSSTLVSNLSNVNTVIEPSQDSMLLPDIVRRAVLTLIYRV
jgi:hypothetical protein